MGLQPHYPTITDVMFVVSFLILYGIMIHRENSKNLFTGSVTEIKMVTKQ